MKLSELFEHRDTHHEVAWHHQITAHREGNGTNWAIVDAKGNPVRKQLTRAAADAIATRTDLVQKYGKLYVKAL
jgi:hypothetical protein